jgi:Vacuolar sorting protein 9 (VPS9) domain
MQAPSVSASPRPSPSLVSKSFSRLDSPSPDTRVRSSSGSINQLDGGRGGGISPDLSFLTGSMTASPDKEHSDIFSNTEEESVKSPLAVDNGSLAFPQTFDELPIEIRSITERFLDSLSARVHPTPLSIDALSDMFQDFYRRAESAIGTHIAALSSRLSRARAPRASLRKDGREKGEQQMLTVEEVAERKNQRRLLELKRLALEEAVERAVCEKVYLKIWHHRSAEDEEQDQKLRSRVAALSLVGIGLKDLLLSGSDDVTQELRLKISQQETKIKDSLEPARANLVSMTQEKYPLGKLQHLNSAHKSIVETLSTFFPASTSADEILPTLIYTLLTSPPDEINVISDLHFIQRFRTASKVDGEAAYCMVNLEAAISFLETVDLPSLRADEHPEGPVKPVYGHKRTESVPMDLGIRAVSPPGSHLEAFPSFQSAEALQLPLKPIPSGVSPRSSRRLSELIQMQTSRLGEAGDSIRGVVRDGADQAVGAVTNTLEGSFRFLFGRIRATQQEQQASEEVPVPKTLEDARKLVSQPTTPVVGAEDDDLGGSALGLVSTNESVKDATGINSRVLDLVGGRRIRDQSVESSRSGSSGRQASFTAAEGKPAGHDHPLLGEDKEAPTSSPALPSEPIASPTVQSLPAVTPSSPSHMPVPLHSIGQHGTAAVESMRNLGNSLNPLNQFAKISLFGRSASSPSAPTSAPGSALVNPVTASPLSPQIGGAATIPGSPRILSQDGKILEAVEDVRKLGPKPTRKFMDCRDSGQLRIGEVDELLSDYKRMALMLAKIMNAKE